jgi:HEPN domain-containing protein
LLDELAELMPYAVEARYPGGWEPPTRERADRAVEIAEKIRLAVRQYLGEQ